MNKDFSHSGGISVALLFFAWIMAFSTSAFKIDGPVFKLKFKSLLIRPLSYKKISGLCHSSHLSGINIFLASELFPLSSLRSSIISLVSSVFHACFFILRDYFILLCCIDETTTFMLSLCLALVSYYMFVWCCLVLLLILSFYVL